MSEAPQRFEGIRRSIRVGRVLGFGGVVAVFVVAAYLYFAPADMLASSFATEFIQRLTAIGILSLILMLSAAIIFLWGMADIALKIEANSFRTYDVMRDIHNALEEIRPHLRTVAENAQLSDTARAIIHRHREQTALRLAINEEIIRGDWEAAYALVELLESRHGYKNEAARLRDEVDRSRAQASEEALQRSIESVQNHMRNHDWDRARSEMDRLLAEYSGNPEVRNLPVLFARLRGEHKRRLLKEWDESVQRNEVDRGIATLRELDQYLTPNEAAALEESARGVFRAKLHNLGVQFSLMVTDHDWKAALSTARQIMAEFPNSRMALEVKDRIPALLARVEGENAAPPPASVAAAANAGSVSN